MSKILLILSILFFSDFAFPQGDAPAILKGQNQVQKAAGAFIVAPAQSVTKVNSSTALIETGNTNILENPGFEHGTYDWAWVVTSGTASVVNSSIDPGNVFSGLKSMKITASSSQVEVFNSSPTNSAAFADGVQLLGMMRVKTNASGLKVCSRVEFTTSTTNCVSVVANNKWNLYKIPFIGGNFFHGVVLTSQGANVTGDLYVDDAFVGAVDLKADVDQSRIAGESYFAGTTNCQWSRTSTTVGAFTATSACPGPTIVEQNMGSWQTTDSDLPRQTINNLPAGKYKATFIVPTDTSNGNSAGLAINDGTSTCEAVQSNNTLGTVLGQIVSCSFSYNSSGNRTFELYGASTANSIRIQNTQASAPRISTKFILEYFGSGSVYSSTNADTDWASCGHTTSDFTGFGTVTNIETQCKREGSDLLMRGKFTTGTPTGVEARLNLKLGGTALTSQSSSTIPTLQSSGFATRSGSSAGSFVTLIEPSVAYITFGAQTGSVGGLTKSLGTFLAAGETFSFNARIPISGWTNSNIIIGQFNGLESCSSTLECTDTFSAKVSSAGVVSGENIDWINGNCAVSSNRRTCTFTSGIFTVAPNCAMTPSSNNGAEIRISSSSSSSVVVDTYLNGVGSSDDFNIICQKQGVDYIGKTAKAVASDQNVRSIGSVGVDIQSVYFGSGSDCATACSSGTCTICSRAGTKITSVTYSSTGVYDLNGIDGTKYICSGSGNGSNFLTAFHQRNSSTSSLAKVFFGSGTTNYNTYMASVTCVGIP